MKLILIAITLLIACTTYAEVKWHPGHYYTIYTWGKNNQTELLKYYDEMKQTPSLRGMQIRYTWRELEKAKGVYDFSQINSRLKELSERKLRLVVLISTRSFTEGSELVPEYLQDPIYDGGAFKYSSENNGLHYGYNIKFYNEKVRERFELFIKALGDNFNSHDYFEAIGLAETAIGKPVEPLTDTQVKEYYAGVILANGHLRKYFPNTITYQNVNYPRNLLSSLIGSLEKVGAALGTPDTFPDEVGLNTKTAPEGVYSYYPKLSGIVALTPSVMQTNYYNTTNNGAPGGHVPTVRELLEFDRDVLKATHIFWTREKNLFPDLLKELRLPEYNRSPDGGLTSHCPSAYGSCVDKLIPACPVSDKIYSQVELDKILADTIAPLNTKIAENELKITEQTVKISEQETKITELNTNMDQKILEGINTWKADFLVKVKSFIFGINE